MKIKILLIDNQRDVTLIKESITVTADVPIIQYAISFRNAQEEMLQEMPDLILIGSGIIIKEGFEIARDLQEVPIVILAETDRFLHLIKNPPQNIYSLMRAFDLDEIPLMLQKAVELFFIHREKLKCT